MKTLRDYEQLIRDCVKKISDKDPNWDFTVKSIAKDKVSIRWTYLDYCEEKDNCFYLILRDYDEEDQEHFLVARTPYDQLIDGEMVTDREDKKSWQVSYESGIRYMISAIADYAHSRY